MSRGPLLAARLSDDPAILTRLEPLLAGATGEHRAALVAALGAGHRLPADALVALLDDESDAVAARAADLLVWVGRAPADRDSIEARLRAGVPPGRNAPLLFAAVALGSTAALLEVRRLFDASAPVTTRAVDALAVAGGAEDTRRLLALATRDEALAPVAVLAAGHLGSRADAQAIATAAGAVDDVVRARALESILGAEPGPPAGAPGPAGAASGRWLRGRPWTTAGALDRLDAADEPIVSRSWHALEAVVRSGVRPGVVFDAAARVGAQRRAGAELRRAVEAARRPLPAGDWHYFGRRLD